jgi:hypothetical protein
MQAGRVTARPGERRRQPNRPPPISTDSIRAIRNPQLGFAGVFRRSELVAAIVHGSGQLRRDKPGHDDSE